MVSPSRCPPWQPERPGPTRREPRRAQRSYTTCQDTIACEAVCSQYVLNEGVTVMGFKVASRVRGLSDEAFREAFGTEEQCCTALVRLRWPDGFVCACCGHREHCVLAGRGLSSMQPVQEADIAHGGHDLPRDQAAADTVVRRHPPDRDGEERHLVGGTRPPSRGQAADGLDREAQDHGSDGAARGGDTAYGAGGDGRCLSRRGALRRQAGPRRGGQDALRGGGLDQSRGAPAQAEAGAGQGLPQARDRARRQALAGPPERRL